ncbi:hypothetical protein ACFFRR_002704 [Megaselia abdita]
MICYVISACFIISNHLEPAFYFGYAGQAIVIIPAYTYLVIRTGRGKFRHFRVALANFFFFTGIAIACNTSHSILLPNLPPAVPSPLSQANNGYMLLGLTLATIAFIILNEILQLTKAYNYKKSRDHEWNSFNESMTLFENEKDLRQKHDIKYSSFKLDANRQNVTIIVLFLTLVERVFFFCITFQIIGNVSFWNLCNGDQNNKMTVESTFIFYAGGCFAGLIFLALALPKWVHLIFGLIKITATIAILAIFDQNNLGGVGVFFAIYFACIGVFSSIPYCSLLESFPFKYTEILFSFVYVFEVIIVEALKYETWAYKNKGIFVGDGVQKDLLGLGVSFSLFSVICIIVVQMYLPHSAGLIEMRSDLIGITRVNFIPRSKLWNYNWNRSHSPTSVIGNEVNFNRPKSLNINNRHFKEFSTAESPEGISRF